MEAKNQSELVKKYWAGETSAAEEKQLLESDLSMLEGEDKAHFQQLNNFADLTLADSFKAELLAKIAAEDKPIRRLNPQILWRVAAAVLVGLSLYFLVQPIKPTAEEIQIAALEEDPEKAFEITKQALLLVSTKLNKAAAVNLPLDKFEEMQTKIKDRN